MLTTSEVAARLGCGTVWVRVLIRAGTLPAVHVGKPVRGIYLIDVETFEDWYENVWQKMVSRGPNKRARIQTEAAP